MPASLLAPVVPQGTFNPRAEEPLPDDSYDLSMDDHQQQQQQSHQQGLPPPPSSLVGASNTDNFEAEYGSERMDADDVEAQLGPPSSPLGGANVPRQPYGQSPQTSPQRNFAGPSSPFSSPSNVRSDQPSVSPSGPPAASSNNAGGAAHIRRKSVIPIDQSILRELASHKSLDDGPLIGQQPRASGPGPGHSGRGV